jgi:hypothetical protein
MARHAVIALALLAASLAGCATKPQGFVPMAESAVSPQNGRLGVAMTALPKVDTHLPGAGCLLCMIAASASNSALSKHSQTLPYEDLPKLRDSIAELLRKKGVEVVVVNEDIRLEELSDIRSETPNLARKDHTPLKKKYSIDRLLVVNITSLGFIRTYSSYFPTSDPKGVLQGAGYIVNLSNNTYDWYLPVNVTRSADKSWDEPPSYPGLTNAYFQVLEIAKDTFLQPFSQGK